MEPADGFKEDVFQRVATTFAPGILAFGPFAAILLDRFPLLKSLLKDSAVLTGGICIVGGVLGGMICENLGSWVELLIWKCLRRKAIRKGQLDPSIEWDRYLALHDIDAFVGQSYLKSLLTRLKFELAMVPSLLFLLSGLLIANCRMHFFNDPEVCLAVVIFLVAEAYFIFEARTTSKLLITVRKNILQAKSSVDD